MNIDTNSITQFNDTALAAKTVAQQWWPTVTAGAFIIARELRNFNAWAVNVADYIIRHGGVLMIFKKLLWNPTGASVLTQTKTEGDK